MRAMRISLALCVLAWCGAGGAAQGAPKRVYVVHSYHEGQVEHVDEMSRGIRDALKDTGAELEFFYMDTKRHTDEEGKRDAGRRAQQKALEFRPDVVLTMDDDAQKYFAVEYSARPDAAPLVFSGVNGEASDYGFPKDNVTGVLERPVLTESIELLQKISPDARKLVLLGDATPTTSGFFRYAKTLKVPAEILAYEQPETFDQFKDAVRKYDGQGDACGVYTVRALRVKEGSDERVAEQDVIAWLQSNSRHPTVGFFDSAAKSGILCGIAVSMYEQGHAAAVIAKGILEGRRPSDFPVRATPNGRIMLNLVTAEHMGLKVRYSIIQNAKEVVR